MRQIELMGQALARALARLLNIKELPDAGLSLDEIKQVYSNELDITLDLVLQTPGDQLIDLLKTDLNFIDQHLEKMAGILSETADLLEKTEDHKNARELRQKCIYILEHLQASTGVYSLERISKISRIRELL